MKNYLIALPILALAVGLTGCGAGSGAPAAQVSRAVGKAVVTVTWPAQNSPSRVIPAAANSIKITLSGGTAPLIKTITRPETAASFSDLVPANYTLTAQTFASADGTGTEIATATVPVTVTAGETATPTLTLTSTISQITSDFAAADIVPGANVTAHLTARDAANAAIPLTAGAITWSSSNSAVVAVSSAGVVTGIAGGTATITATDAESGKQVHFDVLCLALTVPTGAAPMDINDTQALAVSLVGPNDTGVTWSVLEGATGGTVDSNGVYTAPAARGTYHVVATSVYDPARSVTIPVTVTAGGVTFGVN